MPDLTICLRGHEATAYTTIDYDLLKSVCILFIINDTIPK